MQNHPACNADQVTFPNVAAPAGENFIFLQKSR